MAFMDYLPQFGQNIPNQNVGAQDDATAQLMLKRRLAQADALRNAEMPQGQMVSGHYVAPSWTQYLANLTGNIAAGKQEEQAMQGYQDYQAGKQKKYAEALSEYENALKPRTEQAEQQPTTITGSTGEMAPNMGMVNAPARTIMPTASDRYNALMRFSAATQNPELAQRAMLGNIEFANKQEETAGERAWREKQTAGDQEFQRIMLKERQGFDLSQQEKNFANQWKLQQSSQGFQAGENAKNRASQLAIHNADIANRPLTEAQANARLYSDRMAASHDIVTKMEPVDTKDKAGNVIKGKLSYDPLIVKSIITSPGGINDAVYAMSSPENQSASQAIRDFINATLRRESGAAISAGEYDNAIRQYFPQMGEDSKVVEQKRLARERAINGIREAGGYPRGQSQQPTQKRIVRTGTDQSTGRKVIQYEDGTTVYADQ